MKFTQSTIRWIERSFQAIPYDIIQKAYIESDKEKLKSLTNEIEGEEHKYLSHSKFPVAIHSFFLVSETSDIKWILNNLETLEKYGFDVYESNRHLFISVDGTGYDLLKEHWEKLYLARGLKWHEN